MAEVTPPEQPLAKLDIQNLSCGRLFDEIPCYISIQDRSFRVLEANRKLIDDFGQPVDRKCYEVYKGRPARCPECPVAHTFADGQEHTSEEVIFDRRGLPHDVVVNTKPLLDHQGSIVAVMELFTDITVQKELTHRLHDSLHRFQNLFDTVPCYISIQDKDFCIVEVNRHFKERFGDAAGRHCYEVYKKRQDRCRECPVARTFEDGKVHHSEQVARGLAGEQLHVVAYTAPIRNRRGETVSVMEVSTDITEMKQLQDKLAELGGLVAGTAHSVKNVLEGLRGGVYIVNMGFREDNPKDVHTGWEMVERNVDRISNMIMDMLYCAKDREPRRLPISLRSVINEVTELFAHRAAAVGVTLVTRFDDDTDFIRGEPKDIHALIANLVTNAIDACGAGSDESKDYRVVVRLHRAADAAVIEVEDNGIGMDEETRNKLFGMFFSTKGAYGTGLGLLVSRKVALEHGGALSVVSRPGMGSTFTVTLPL